MSVMSKITKMVLVGLGAMGAIGVGNLHADMVAASEVGDTRSLVSMLGTAQSLTLMAGIGVAPDIDQLLADQSLRDLVGDTPLTYTVSEGGDDFVLAFDLGGRVVVGSMTSIEGLSATCAEYNADCVAQVTADESLIAAAPNWVTLPVS